MMQNKKETKSVVFYGDNDDSGTITFNLLPDKRLEIEIFHQDTMRETISVSDKNKIISWLVNSSFEPFEEEGFKKDWTK